MSATWITIAILVITIAMMAYPIAQLVPKPQDKRRMKLRQEAMKLGYQIQMRTPKIDERMKPLYPNLIHCVGYYLPKDNPIFPQTCTAIKNPINGEWLWLHQRFPPNHQLESITHQLKQLPQ
ncbi:MAG: hypothetical protein OXE99_11020, partial [Cellvibrionales bacterium]|nr:hypothetical protein [Cellvibrionales bacterium]